MTQGYWAKLLLTGLGVIALVAGLTVLSISFPDLTRLRIGFFTLSISATAWFASAWGVDAPSVSKQGLLSGGVAVETLAANVATVLNARAVSGGNMVAAASALVGVVFTTNMRGVFGF